MFDGFTSPWMMPFWCACWIAAFAGPKCRPDIHTLWQGERLVAVWPLMLSGGALKRLEPLGWPQLSVWLLLLTAIFVSIGLSLIFHNRMHKRWKKWTNCGENIGVHAPSDEYIDGDSVSISESFNEVSKYLHADCLRQANISSSFGKLNVFFDNVKLSPNGAEVYVDVSFGKIELYLPKDWRVIDQVHTSAGAVSNNPRTGAASPDMPILTVKGRVSFGNLELRYI